MSTKIINEFSLIPGSTSTSNTSAPVNPQDTSKNTASLTDQIKKLTQKIQMTNAAAKKATLPDQQQLQQLIAQLQQAASGTVPAQQDEEDNDESTSEKVGKAVGGVAGVAVAPELATISGPLGRAAGGKVGKMIHKRFFSQQDEQKLKKNKHGNINNNKDMATTKNEVKESIAGTVGDVTKGVIDTAGDVGGMIPVVGGVLKGAANIASRGVGAVLGSNQDNEEAESHNLTHAQYKTLAALKKDGWKKEKTEHKEHGHVVHLTKASDRNTTHKCTVEPDGSCDKSHTGGTEQHNENVAIHNFLKSISQKKYSAADKYLGSLVNEKLKKVITNAINK